MNERHRAGRANWLRAAVLGANDGLISTGSLVLGVAAADARPLQAALASAIICRRGGFLSSAPRSCLSGPQR